MLQLLLNPAKMTRNGRELALIWILFICLTQRISVECLKFGRPGVYLDDSLIIPKSSESVKTLIGQPLTQLILNGGEDEQQELLESNIPKQDEIYLLEEKDYPKSIYEYYQGVGQVSGLTVLPSGDVAIFHRSNREWNDETFQANNSVTNWQNANDNLIKNDTILIIDREHGGAITSFGSNLFYMPHGIASDPDGNIWLTDVGRHQVLRLPITRLQENHLSKDGKISRWLPGNSTRLWPDLILGEAFVPGDDARHFCKPSEVVVSPNGRLVFIADGYCNNRIVVYSSSGEYLTSFGQDLGFNVVHSLTIIEDRDLICAADRENARILCFRAGLKGDLSSIGQLLMTYEYPLGRVFAIESLNSNNLLVSSNQIGTTRYDLAALNPFTNEIKQILASSDLVVPHSMASSRDKQYAYVAELSKSAFKKVFKFDIILRRNI